MKRALALLLVCCLLALPALADEPLSMLPAVNDYAAANYTDVPQDSWYAQAAQVCYETGLITGTDTGFSPEKLVSVSQAAAIAARLGAALEGNDLPAAEAGSPWYAPYLSYFEAKDPAMAADLTAQAEETATRSTFFSLLAAVLPASYTPAINTVSTLPDTDDADVLRFYNAGILTGKDPYGTFDAAGSLSRAEAAAMAARIVQPQLRQRFTLQSPPQPSAQPDAPLSYEEELMQTEALRVNGHSIPFQTLLDNLNSIIFRTDFGMAADGGKRLDWTAQYQGIDDLEAYFLDQAVSQTIQDYLIASRASALGCQVSELPQALTPDPAAALDRVYLAKHILVADEATAVSLLAQLMASPSLALFDQLIDQYNTDPGMKSNPNGYLFTDGDMVTSFENAVKALNVGSCSTVPVQSDYGWHIILRLDPKSYPDWEKEVQALLYQHYVEDWTSTATVTPNTTELGKLDVRGRYEQYLLEMGM